MFCYYVRNYSEPLLTHVHLDVKSCPRKFSATFSLPCHTPHMSPFGLQNVWTKNGRKTSQNTHRGLQQVCFVKALRFEINLNATLQQFAPIYHYHCFQTSNQQDLQTKTKTQSKYKIVKTIRPKSQHQFTHYEYNRDHHHLLTKWKGRLLLSFSLKESLFCFTISLEQIHGAEPPKKGLGSSEATIHVWGGLC